MNAIAPRRAFLGALFGLPLVSSPVAAAVGRTNIDPVMAMVAEIRTNRVKADAVARDDDDLYGEIIHNECVMLNQLAEVRPTTIDGVAEYLQAFIDFAEDMDCQPVAIASAVAACRRIAAA